MVTWLGRLLLAAGVLLALLSVVPPDALAAVDYLENTPPLLDRLTPEVVAAVFPGAVRLHSSKARGLPRLRSTGPKMRLSLTSSRPSMS